MNYENLYAELIDNARSAGRSKNLGVYYEGHHITPKCMGGSNKRENIVLLTAKEHFVAHHLLVKIHPKNRGITIAFSAMCNKLSPNRDRNYNITAIVYSNAKKAYIASQSGKNSKWYGLPSVNLGKKASAETLAKMSAARKGVTFSAEHKKNLSLATSGAKHYAFGKKLTEEHKTNIGLAGKGRKHTQEAKDRIREAHKGRTFSEGHRKNISLARKARVVSEEELNRLRELIRKLHTEENRKKTAEAMTGRKWYTDGNVRRRARECPEGFRPGRKLNSQSEGV